MGQFLDYFDNENWGELLEQILLQNYDKVYRVAETPALLELQFDDVAEVSQSIVEFMQTF